MVLVEGGTFTMGCTPEQSKYCIIDEQPAHQVKLSSFYISKFEVTQEQYEAVMDSNPSTFENCPRCPVETISWSDARAFINKLNTQTGKNYRLPTEAEWEYAARGGNKSKGYVFSGSNDVDEVAWLNDNSERKTHPVGLKKPNELGLYDMSGNVWEWCHDYYGPQYYKNSPLENPKGEITGQYRILRGGSWFHGVRDCRVSIRGYKEPTSGGYRRGFRLAKDL